MSGDFDMYGTKMRSTLYDADMDKNIVQLWIHSVNHESMVVFGRGLPSHVGSLDFINKYTKP